MLSSASDKAKSFTENVSKNSNLGDSGISLPIFPSRTKLKLHNISVIPKIVKKVVMNLDLPKTSGPDCIPVVVLKNSEPELSYILDKLFNKCLKEFCFSDCWKVSDLLEFQVRYLALCLLFSVIYSFEWSWKESVHKNTQLILELLKAPFLVLQFSWYKLMVNDLPDNVICNIAFYTDDTLLYSKCHQASDLWKQLELASELEPDLQDTMDWGKKQLVDFNAGKNSAGFI